jgi:hypothetical protein
MQKKKKTGTRIPGTRIRPKYPGIYWVVLAPYPTRIRSCTIRVLPVFVPNIKYLYLYPKNGPELVAVSGTRFGYPACFHPYISLIKHNVTRDFN